MGFFSNIVQNAKNLISNPIGELKSSASDVLNALSAAYANPGTFITNPGKAIAQTNASSATTNVAKTVVNTGLAAAALVSGGTVASKLVPTTAKGIIAATTAGVVGTGILVSNPSGTIESVLNAPGKVATLGADVGTFSKNPSVNGVLDLVTKHPVASTVAVGTLAVVGAKTALAVASTLETERLIETQKEMINQAGNPSASNIPISEQPNPNQQVIPTSGAGPTTSPTTTISTGQIRRRRRKLSRSSPEIINKVNVMVQNSNRSYSVKRITKRYINAIPL